MRYEKPSCVAVIGSVTQAMRAQSILSAAAIRSEVVKADEVTEKSRGCAYAIVFSCEVEEIAKSVLRNAGIRVRMKQEKQ